MKNDGAEDYIPPEEEGPAADFAPAPSGEEGDNG